MYQEYHKFIDETQEAAEHTVSAVALTFNQSLASVVIILSALPEFFGVYETSGSYALAAATAGASVVGVGVAMQRSYHLPFPIPGLPFWIQLINLWWLPYIMQFFISLAVIKLHGGGVEMLYPALSLIGAIYAAAGVSEARKNKADVKQQSREDALFELELEKKREMDAITIENRRLKQREQFGSVQPPTETADIAPDVQQNPIAAISEEQARLGQQKGKETQKSAAQQRQMRLLNILMNQHVGKSIDDLNKSELGRTLDVSHATIGRDIKALRSAGRLNGVVK